MPAAPPNVDSESGAHTVGSAGIRHAQNSSRQRTARSARWLIRLGCAVFIFLGLYLFRAPVLRGLAWAWIVDDPLKKADAIVVLGGGLDTRPFAAARLFSNGYAPTILVLNTKVSPSELLEVQVPQTELTKQILTRQAVPSQCIVKIGNQVSSTFEEAMAVKDWLKISGAKRIIVPTDLFHTRRVKWLFRKQLNESHAAVCVITVPSVKYDLSNWWQHEEGLVDFQNEVIKNIYYRLKY